MQEGLQKDTRGELKVTTWSKGYSNTYHYQKTATKIDMLWSGEAVWEIDGTEVQVAAGDYVIVPPGIKTRIKNVLSDIIVVQTVKFPSIPDDKVVED